MPTTTTSVPLGEPAPFVDLTLKRVMEGDSEKDDLLREVSERVASVQTDHSIFRDWCERADGLYYATRFTAGGADLWPDDPSASTRGRSHVSVNTPQVYVDIPAALQAVEPIERMLATKDSDEARTAANHLERVREAWKVADKWPLKRHKATTTKSLYGKTSGFVYYDKDEDRPCVDIVEQPRNLYMGFKSDTYDEVEWAAYVTRQEPNAVVEQFGVDIRAITVSLGQQMPWVMSSVAVVAEMPYIENFGPARIEVWDYWYRRPATTARERGKPVKMDTWNVVVAGNEVVSGPLKYDEYEGEIPYRPLRNTFIPGTPNGRAELYDVEHIIREKMERITAGSQMIAGATGGDYWQLTGPDAPSRVPAGAKPKRNEVATPGAGNRIEAITPFIAQFQLEQYLGRLDREAAVITGLNDLLLGLVPAQALSSSKAVNALIANYEARLSMRRLLLYTWEVDIWELALKVWAKKSPNIAKILNAGGGRLEIVDPSLSPRDEMETATRAGNLVGAKLWSQARGMDAVGVDDPEQEQNIIREERTDATMFPADVQTMAQLLGILKQLSLPTPSGVQGQTDQTISRGQADLQSALGAGTASGTNATQGADVQGQLPPEGISPGGSQPAGAPFAQGPAPAQSTQQVQTMLSGGKSTGRILTSTKTGRK